MGISEEVLTIISAAALSGCMPFGLNRNNGPSEMGNAS